MTKSPLPRSRVKAGLLAGFLAALAAGPARAALPGASQAAGQSPSGAPVQSPIEIEHRAPACVQAGKYARLDACFRPASVLARARVYFRKGGTTDWFYVEMAPNAPCHRALLPRPRKDIGRIEYYISATDRRSSEARTKDVTLLVIDDGSCSAGPLAPIAESGSVVIGSATGAAPVGFVTAGGLSPLLIAGGAAVVGGGTAAILAGGNDTPPTTTTTTTMPCETPNQRPVANIISPVAGSLAGISVTVNATASDPAPNASGIREVRFWFVYSPLSGDLPQVFIGTDTTGPSPYTMLWTFPSCAAAPEDRFRIIARSVDNCNNVSDEAPVTVRLVGRGCFRSDAVSAQAGVWLSELQPPGARGQVVVDGTQAVFPSAGTESFTTPLGPGLHRFEATLVAGRGEDRRSGGTWRFDLSALRLTPGSLRIVSGEVARVAADAVVFRLRGRAGERVVFGFEVAGP